MPLLANGSKTLDKSENHNLQILGSLLERCFDIYKNLVLEYQEKKSESDNLKQQYETTLREFLKNNKCEKCHSSQGMDLKNGAEQLPKPASIELQNLEFSRTSNGSDTTHLEEINSKISTIYSKDVTTFLTISTDNLKEQNMSPKKNVPENNQSLSEIEGTPTGRCSPIFATKSKAEKKKSSQNCNMPESKLVKLSLPSSTKENKGNRKLRQTRFHFEQSKKPEIIDLSTCSVTDEKNSQVTGKIKTESFDNDDTILPSPTSGPVESKYRTSNSKIFKSPNKLLKSQPIPKCTPDHLKSPLKKQAKLDSENPILDYSSIKKEDESINLLQPNRNEDKNGNGTDTQCILKHETDSSVSLLGHLQKLEDEPKQDSKITSVQSQSTESVTRMPLLENINCDNILMQCDTNVSVSLLKPFTREVAKTRLGEDFINKGNMQNIYKETLPRRKAEKKALPGWWCDNCKKFFDALYKDDPVMLKKHMAECSKHRGKINPIRPETPPGLWEPRWDVEIDTEAFNRQNNVT